MAKAPKGADLTKQAQEEVAAGATTTGQGRAVVLPNGERRVDYIHRRYYDDKIGRGDIVKEINRIYELADDKETKVQYQIVYAATKSKEDPRKSGDATAAAAAE